MNKLNNENNEKHWRERNKKKIIIVGSGALATVVGLLLFKKRDAFLALLNNVETVTNAVDLLEEDSDIDVTHTIKTYVNPEIKDEKKPINNGNPFEVRAFVRTLPDNRRASDEKAAQAEELGIVLGEHQTLVSSYYKNAV